ncbi:MAG TPA: galactose-1-phosphate uridylyltransferase [Enhygromyxa sp.]|nr:galactose-1-phosphate uridylyltransferase [Enhygromyxa sp.]
MHRRALTKPDGRSLVLYGREPVDEHIEAPAAGAVTAASSHLRWHPLRGEWVVYAGHRQHRTFLPPAEWNPLAPSTDPAHPTEVPGGRWDVAVFDNLFSALGSTVPPPQEIVATAPGLGTTEVVVFTQDPKASLGSLALDHIALIIEVWADRTRVLAAREDVAYVLPFENRGVEVGVTLHHPHGQIYAYPFVPPVAERQLELQRSHHQSRGTGLLADLIAAERAADQRTLHVGERALAWVPVCARWAYEIWIAPLRQVATLAELEPEERRDFARALQIALRKLDRLWQRPMPYVLAIYQAPTRGVHPYAHLHLEILPWLRMPGRIKYLAGSEVAAGTFTADTLPEAKAEELRAVEISHD